MLRTALTVLAASTVLLSGCAEMPPTPGAAASATGTQTGPGAQSGPGAKTTPHTKAKATPKAAPKTATKTKARKTLTKQGTALAALNRLPVKGKAPKTGYDRDQFGTEWSDAVGAFTWSRNGCDTRNDALRRDLGSGATVESNRCVVTAGTFTEPYSGKTFQFIKGSNQMETSLDIDHVVALGNVWISGGWKWTTETRALVANDPLNLLAVSASLNRQKSDANAAEWLPPAKGFRCGYVARQVAVKKKYQLAVTDAEQAAMRRVLAACPNQKLPAAGAPVTIKTDPNAGRPTQPTTAPAPGTGNPTGGAVYYANCTEARAAGAAPLLRGQPGYGPHLDRDGDGDACE